MPFITNGHIELNPSHDLNASQISPNICPIFILWVKLQEQFVRFIIDVSETSSHILVPHDFMQ